MEQNDSLTGSRKKTAYQIVMAAALSFLFFMLMTANWKQKEQEPSVLHFGMFAGSYWDVPTGNCYQIIDDAIDRFEAEHEGVKVEYVSGILKEDYPEWLAEQILLGKEPDVFMIPAGETDMMASSGILKELDRLIQKDSTFHADAYYKSAYDYGRIGQVQYALPFEAAPMLMFVNKTLLEQEGIAMPGNDWTWKEFRDICRQVTRDTDGDGAVDQFGSYDYRWKNAAWANGGVLFSEDGRTSGFGDPKVEEAVRFVKELTEMNQGYTITARDFDKGKVAFRPLYYSEYRTYKPYPWRIKKYSDFEWDCIQMPAGPEGSNCSELDTFLMGISGRTEKERLAWEFLKTLCYEEETQRQILKDSQGLPVIRKVTESPEAQKLMGAEAPGTGGMDMNVISQVMDGAITLPNFRKYDTAMDMADQEIERMIDGTVSMDSGLLKLQREINQYLRQ